MTRLLPLVAILVVAGGCGPGDSGGSAAADSALLATQAGVNPTPTLPRRFGGIGRPASNAEVQAWDSDVNPEGVGLPAGSGTHARGATVYAQQCAVCHGVKGEGIAPNPGLVGPEPRDFSFADNPSHARTIGNYWPYATTLWDYINRAMPFNAPGTLSADDVYALTAFLLVENGIVERSAVMNRRTLPQVRMPARDRFVRDDRSGGSSFR